MRRQLATLVGAALVLGALTAPAGVAEPVKKKKIKGSYSATLLPFPKLAAMDPTGGLPPGCLAGVQDVHWAAEPFEAPAAGRLVASMEGFTGDWDLYFLDEQGQAIFRGHEGDQILGGAPPEERLEMDLTKGQVVSIAICNWLGAPQASVSWEFTYVARKGGGHKHR